MNKILTKILYIDLQLFAEGDVINTTGTATLSAEMKTYYDKELIRLASPKLIHAQFGQKRSIPKNGGKKIEFRRYAALPKATEPLTEGVTPPGQTMEVLTVEATLHQYGDYVKMSDVLQLTAIDNNILEATTLCGDQGSATMDTVVRNIMNSGTNVTYCPKIGADGKVTEVVSRADLDTTSVLTCDVVDGVVAKLKAQNAPKIDGWYVAIIHPYAAYDLTRDERWRKPHEYCKPEELFKGELGEYGGVRFVDSSEAKIFSGEGCPDGLGVFSTLFMGANAYGVVDPGDGASNHNMEIIVKPLGSAGSADPLNQRSTVGWKAMETAAILIQEYLVRVESCSPKYSAVAVEN